MEAKRRRHQPNDIEEAEGREDNWPNRAPFKSHRCACIPPISPTSAELRAASGPKAVSPLPVRRERRQLLQSLED